MAKLGFDPVDPKVNFPKLESELIEYWKKNKTFEKSVENRPKNKKWTFLDGPPFVTGMPHYGHLLGSIHKDVFGRYWTMKGYQVPRVWGWDGHGLPIENKVENKLEIKRKKDIEEVVGVKRFIEECKTYVEQISGEWEWYVDHIGRWVDIKNAYKTWDKDYMESVMWVFKEMYDKGHIYKGLRVSLYCPHCATPISNFEVAMDADNYQEITEPANTYKYKVVGQKNTFFLAWSTTPWNKIATPALAVNPKLIYIKVQQGSEFYILAKTTTKILLDSPKWKIVEEIKGDDLVGTKFEPHYDFYTIEKGKKAFEVIPGDFVTAEDGTGIVTIAAYGEDDLKAMHANSIQVVLHVDEEGHLTKDVPNWGGMYYLKVNKLVNKDLAERGLIYKEEKYTHTIPNCWRCHTRLYYAPLEAWFVDVQKLKPLMKKTNEEINWFPKHFKHGRFLKSLENAPDWNISRNRYWGSPVPVWECECGEYFVPGSIKELEEASGVKIKDLHKPEIDEVEITCKKCGKKVKRVPEVLDSWIEAGSASFAERHFPFDKTQKLEDFFPPDFIAEYTGQIRAWFYVLHVIGAALYKSKAFKNVGVEGVVLGSDGRKMSKNLGNYPDPKEMLTKYGGDALRLYLMGSPVMRGEDMIISEDQYKFQVRGTLLILWNVYNFFVYYANLDGWKSEKNNNYSESENILDKWILSLLNNLVEDVTRYLDGYDTMKATVAIGEFINELSTWFIRRSRDRVGPASTNENDRNAFYETTYHTLRTLCKIAAPILPFITESIYRNLAKEESVHLTDWPEIEEKYIDENLEKQMKLGRKIIEIGHSLRKELEIPLRRPIAMGWHYEPKEKITNIGVILLIKEELNIIDWINEDNYSKFAKMKDFRSKSSGDGFSIDFLITETDEVKEIEQTRQLIRKIQSKRKEMGMNLTQKVEVFSPWIPRDQKLLNLIQAKTMASSLASGEFKVIKSK